MKDQYFADRRDFLKYELLLDLAEQVPPRRLLSVLMLTPDDGSAEGNVVSYTPGLRRPELHAFLRDCLGVGTRRVSLLRDFMTRVGVDYLPYRDDEYFGDGREAYFSSCAGLARDHTLIFLDPDVGLESGTVSYMRRRGLDKYLMHAELAAIAVAAPKEAVFVVYQHLPNDKRLALTNVEKKCRALCTAVRSSTAAYATDLDVAFLVTSRVSEAFGAATKVVRRHERHGLKIGEVAAQQPLEAEPRQE
jgi:hypothetical protein